MITSEQIRLLPHQPGVYMMKDNQGRVVYVGKAIDIQKRIRSHCQRRDGGYASPFMEYVDSVEPVITDNEVEALLLEYNLIKKYNPLFNVKLKDDKRYPYIKITMQEEFPRAYITRTVAADGAHYFGPYPHVSKARRTLSALHEIFPIRTCKYESEKLLKIRPCLDYEMGRCCAPCGEIVTKQEYRQFSQSIVNFLRGQPENVIQALDEKMSHSAEQMMFEKAAFYRDILEAAKQFAMEQKMMQRTVENQDFVGFGRVHDISCVNVIRRRGGRVIGSTRHLMDDVKHADTPEILNAFLEQFYLHNADIPREIFISANIGKTRLQSIEKIFSDIAEHKVTVKIPQRGLKHSMLKMAEKNSCHGAEQQYRKIHGIKQGVSENVIALQEALRLEILPLRIEGYDIANTQGSDSVGAMVVFHDGKPKKSDYRKFRIKDVDQVDDYASMKEMLRRRFLHGKDDKEEKGRFAETPDLIMIDGGKGHLNAALEVLDELDIKQFPVCSLAKREEEIFLPGLSQPIRLDRKNKGLRLLQNVRDEAHRFGTTYHAQLRGKKMKESFLRKLSGIGPAKERELLRRFGSLEKIKQTSVEELTQVSGINESLAGKIMDALNKA